MKEELKQILKELNELLNETGLKITDSELIDFSLRIYNTNQINNKKLNTPFIKNELSPKERLTQEDNTLATPNQIAFLKKQGKPIPDKISKKEAYLLIKGIKERDG